MKSLLKLVIGTVFFCLLSLTVLQTGSAWADDGQEPEIRLVLQVTVDGLRADLLNRYSPSFSENGFKYLSAHGISFENAQYQHANTETIVGHATLATGAHPRHHGMVGNVWFDRDALELAYNIEDPKYPLLPTRDGESEGAQVDPAQKRSRTQGRSPAALLVPTLSDMMSAYYTGKSKAFGVSGKDRSAVVMAGKTGKAFWFSTNSGDFVTSSYYYKEYPTWAADWNSKEHTDSYAGKAWELPADTSTYSLADRDDRPYEADLNGYGRTFPHPFGQVDDPLFYTRVLVSPVGDQLTLDFSKKLIVHEELGKDEVPDYLSISFSGVDAVNHFFGPSSLENEDTVVQLDKTLAQLFSFIDKQVGLDHTLVVLSADHGMADMPEYLEELGYATGRIDPDEIVRGANEIGKAVGIDKVVRFFYRPYIYLDEKKIVTAGQSLSSFRQTVAKSLSDMQGVFKAVSLDELGGNMVDPLLRRVYNNQHPFRSGDIYIAQEPYWFLFDKGPVVAMHGSPWRYDTHIPVFFAGPYIMPGKVAREINPVDIVPTVASYLGLTPPAASVGKVLAEVVTRNRN